MEITIREPKEYAPLLLRIGMSIVFLYFGISQLVSPESFIGWLPAEVSLIPLSARTFVILNGGFEVFFGTLLLLGLWRRISALLLGLHLLGITFSIGFTEIGVRDFGLSIAGLTIALISYDRYSLDEWIKKRLKRDGAPDEAKEEYEEYYEK